jgi:hypothetical protein
LLPGRSSRRGARALGRQPGVLKCCPELRYLRLFGCHIGFEGTTFKPIELIAILDLGALFEQAPFYKCGHASDDVDPIDRFAKKFAGSVIGRLVASTMPTAGSPPGQVVSGPTHWR